MALSFKTYIPVIANIDGDTAEDYHKLAKRLSALENLAALEVNISCPNVEKAAWHSVKNLPVPMKSHKLLGSHKSTYNSKAFTKCYTYTKDCRSRSIRRS